MKNFSMPKYVSPTLEADEMLRLKQSLGMTVSKEMVDNIISKLPLGVNSTPIERAKWVENLSVLLENTFDEDTVKAIRQNCYCNENGRLEATAKMMKQLYLSLNRDLNRFVNALNENGASWYIQDNQLYTKMFTCECPMLEEAKISNSLTWCHCTAGYNKKLFETVFEVPIEVEVLHSIRQGFEYCLLRITFK